MNILIVADVSLANVIGGAERVLYEQATRFVENGHTVHVITRKLTTHESHHQIIHNVQEWRYDINQANSLTFLKSTISNGQTLYRQIAKDIHFDLINFHQPFSALALYLLKETHKTPKIYTCHSLAFEEYMTRTASGSIWSCPLHHGHIFLRKWLEKFCLTKSQKVIVLSQFTKNKLIYTHHIPEHKIAIIPGGADLKHFRPSLNIPKIRRKLHIPEHKFVLFTVRNLVERMGLENLIKTITLLRNSIKNIYLIIAGTGILKEKLQILINANNLTNHVQLAGFVVESDLPLYCQTADFFVLPTIALEGFGLVTVEAMACGTPVLGTPIGGTKEILNNFDPSFLFHDTNPESLAELILGKYLKYKDRSKEYTLLRDKCRAFVEENYSWERNVLETERLFKQCVESAEN